MIAAAVGAHRVARRPTEFVAPEPVAQAAPEEPSKVSPYTRWLQEDVVYIIAAEERAAFLRLETDDERDDFIEQFWLRRDPTPDTPENEFKDEHYRRIAFANLHFPTASGKAGWKTDRGASTFGSGRRMKSTIIPRANIAGQAKSLLSTGPTAISKGDRNQR